MSFFHRLGSSLNLHYHLVVLDGVFSAADSGEVSFHEAYELTADRVGRLEATVQRLVLRYFARRGLLDEAHAGDGGRGPRGRRAARSVLCEPTVRARATHTFDGAASLASPESRLLCRFPKPDVNGRTEMLLLRQLRSEL